MTQPISYVEPATIEEAVERLAAEGADAFVIGGGTSLVLLMRQQLIQPRLLVGLRRVGALRGIRVTDAGALEIGAMATHRSVERADAVRRYEPALATAFGRIATVRIRNQGTVGGNLAHADPAQDPPAILMALDASVVVAGPGGRRRIALESLFVDYMETSLRPGEIIESVRLPPRGPDFRATYAKFLPRTRDDYATVAIAASGRALGRRWSEVRLIAGAAGSTPIRLRAAEAHLEGTDLSHSVIQLAAEAAAAEVDPISDLRGSSLYKRDMVRVWTRRALDSLAGPVLPRA
jgi:carbon-monoxide dehydrogenase medium subunit